MQARIAKRGLSLVLFLALITQLLPTDFWGSLVPHAAAAESTVIPEEYLYEYEIPLETEDQTDVIIPPTVIDKRTEALFAEEKVYGEAQMSAYLPETYSGRPLSNAPTPDANSARYIEIIKSCQSYSQLSAEDSEFLCAYTGIDSDVFQILDAAGYSLSSAISYGCLAAEFGCEIERVLKAAPDIETAHQLAGQIALYHYYIDDVWAGTELDRELRDYLLEGFSFEQVMNAYGVQQRLDIPMADLLVHEEQLVDSSEVQKFADELGLSAVVLAEYTEGHDLDAQSIEEMLFEIEAIAAQLKTGDASVYSDTPEDEETEVSNRNLGAPYTYDSGANEKVALNSGALIYESEDYVIPGVNGLDLVITRRYNSQEANAYKPKTNTSYMREYVYYVNVVGTAYSDVPGYGKGRWPYYDVQWTVGPFSSHADAVSEQKKINGTSTREKNWQGDGADLVIEYTATIESRWMGSTPIYSTSREENTSYNDLYGLGHGWSLAFSSVEIVDESKYLHLANGSTYEVDLSGSGSHLKDYPLEDLVFVQESEKYTNGAVKSEYSLYYKDGKKEYFDAGGRLLAIQDRYNNTISFTHTTQNGYPYITITDTLGRDIIISGQSTEDGHDMVVSLPMNITMTYHVKNWEPVQALASYTNAAGVVTQYGYELQTANFSTVSKATSGASNEYLNLTTVTHPTSAQSVYTYEIVNRNLGPEGLMEAYRLSSRKDSISGKDSNVLTYCYSTNDCSGHPAAPDPESLPASFTYWATVTDGAGLASTATFNNEHLQTKVDVSSGNDKVQEIIYEYNSDKLPIKISTRQYGKTNQSAPLESIELTEYDHKGNITAEWSVLARGSKSDAYKTSYTYDSSYSILLSKVYKTDADTTVTMQNTLSAGGKDIVRTEVLVNDTLRQCTEYTTDGYGNRTEQRVYQDGFSKYDVTQYSYFNHAYLSAEKHVGVKDADGVDAQSTPGESAGTIATLYYYDEIGRMIQSIDENGQSTKYTYDELGNVVTTTLPDGSSVIYDRDYTANTVTVTDENGAQLKYRYTPLGLEYETVDVLTKAVIEHRDYDEMSRLSCVQDYVYGGTTTYSYDAQGRVLSETTKEGSTILAQTNYAYDDAAENGLYTKVTKTVVGDSTAPSVVTTQYTDYAGNLVKTGKMLNETEYYDTYTYDYTGNLLTECTAATGEEGLPFTTKYEYNGLGQTMRVYNAYGQYVSNVYDTQGRLVRAEDYSQTPTTYSYDALGRLLTQTITISDGVTATTKYAYDPCGNIVEELTPSQMAGDAATWNKTQYEYDARDRLVKVSQYDGGKVASTTQYTYDKVGNMLTVSVGNNKTIYTYDRFGNVLTETDALGGKETYSYSELGRLTKKIDRNGSTIAYTYDGMGRMTSSTIGTQTISTEYAKTGVVAQEQLYRDQTKIVPGNKCNYIHNESVTSQYLYDSLGRMIQQTNRESEIVKKVVTSDSGVWTKPIIPINPPPRPVEPPISTYSTRAIVSNVSTTVKSENLNQYTYDLANNRIGYTLVNGSETLQSASYTYDALNRMTAVLSDGKVKAAYTYDVNGNRASISYPNGTTTTYTYNRANWVTKVNNPESSYSYTYYVSGNQAGKIDQKGHETSYTYDGLGRLTKESESSGQVLEYVYDSQGNRTCLRASGADNYVINYTYGAGNRLLKEQKTGSKTVSTDYTYDGNGNMLTAEESKDGAATTTKYTYDIWNRLTSVTVGAAAAIEYTYNAQGLRISKTADGNTQTYLWDGDQLAATLGATTELLADFTIPNSGSLSLDTAGSGLTGGAAYSLIINGTHYTAVAEEADFSVASLTTHEGQGDDEHPETPSGLSGEQVTQTTVIVLSAANVELVQYSGGGLSVTGPAGTTVQLLDGAEPTAEIYIRGLNLVAAERREKDIYYHYDAHGDVVQLSSSCVPAFREYVYDAFGVEKAPVSTDVNLFRYCGEQYDPETGNYYLRARYYDPALGRFTQEDTHWNVANMIYGDNPQKTNERQDALGLTSYTYVPQISAIMQSGNLYVYCVDNPVIYADKNGEWIHIVVGAVVGGVLGGIMNGITQYSTTGHVDWGELVINAAGGAVGGALTSIGCGAVASAVASGATSVVSQAYKSEWDFSQVDITIVLIDSAIGALGGNMKTLANHKHLGTMGKNFINRIGGGEGLKALKYYASQTLVDNWRVIKDVASSYLPWLGYMGYEIYAVKVK